MERYYNLYRGSLPLSTFTRFVTAVSAILSLVSYVALPRCGVATTLGNARSGFDSPTVLAYAIDSGYTVYPVSFDYGQRHIRELRNSKFSAQPYYICLC